MAKYRQRVLREIEAIQLRWATWNEVCDFLGDAFKGANPDGATYCDNPVDSCGEPGPRYIQLNVITEQGSIVPVRHGEWIIKDKSPGRFYPCDPKVFAELYSPAT